MTLKTASILLAHGSSDPHWLAPFDQLLQRIRSSLTDPQARAELAYMELAEPSLQTQVKRLASEGYKRIDVLPLFFAAGRHLRKDVPAMLDELQQQLQQQDIEISIHLHTPIGLEPEVADAISQVVLRQMQ
ncbi:MAG: CbiX/SirB N-terminal domain-containing protein [Saccharospirillaceae bacterium]|nr:CbiX/SirB N-terminal domain-containing protein [Saccharospirillaceae bacterium]MCD8532685.1 CbiX/SirB N-terminal domain-containing protein [Saccharospirillaceae bacterium]